MVEANRGGGRPRPVGPGLLALAALLAGCAKEAPPAPAAKVHRPPPPAPAPSTAVAAPAWVVSATGIGRVRIGWSVAQLNQALGEQLKPTYEVSDQCDHLRPAGLPAGVSLMVVLDTVVRVDVDTTGVPTAEGAGVGDTEARILALYRGRIRVEPHKYTGPEGHYLIVTIPSDTLSRIIFETDGHTVQNYRAGRRPAVEFVEGCA